MFEYAATMLRIIDGDTVDLNVSLGFRIFNKDRFRLIGIDTPERGQPGWAEASVALAGRLPAGTAIIINTERPYKDKYGRWLARIFLEGEDINLWMIAQGHAVEYMA